MRKKILIIEDDDALIRLLKKFLDERDYELIFTDSAESGKELAIKHKPQLVILDVILPGISGVETLKMIKGDDQTKYLPVIMLTSLSDEEKINDAKILGACEYVIKSDLSLNSFLDKIKQNIL